MRGTRRSQPFITNGGVKMGIMDRLSTLIRANVNDLIDRAEDPEKMLDQILRDMQSNIQVARTQVAAMIAQEKELEIDLNQTNKLALEWGNKAQKAVDAGKDDLAREALRRKRDNEQNAAVYQQQLTVQEQAVEQLKKQMRQLEQKYSSTMSQRDVLIARSRRAHAQQKVAEKVSSFSPMDPSADLDRMERKIRSSEAHAAALTEMGDESYETQFRELDMDDDIEAQLQALKSGAGIDAPVGELTGGQSDTQISATEASTTADAASDASTPSQ
jgi:phage shock protein A